MNNAFEQAQQFAGLWMEFATRMMQQAGFAFDPGRTPPEMARQMRSLTFQALSQQAEQFMRSPAYLDMMKQGLDAAISFRKQMNEMLTGMQHNLQGVARQDIDTLMLTVRHMETRLLDVMDGLASRVEQIAQRLDALEGKIKARSNGDLDLQGQPQEKAEVAAENH